MGKLTRFGVSVNSDLLVKFDSVLKNQNYSTRSNAIEDFMRQTIVNCELSNDSSQVVGSINIIYDHHRRELLGKLTDIQHDFQAIILSSHHIHLGHHNCFEAIIVKGEKKSIEELASKIKSTKGVKNSTLRLIPL